VPRTRLGPSARPMVWTPFEPFNACCIAVPSRTGHAGFHALFDKLVRNAAECRELG
jgi:hypothetical protein